MAAQAEQLDGLVRLGEQTLAFHLSFLITLSPEYPLRSPPPRDRLSFMVTASIETSTRARAFAVSATGGARLVDVAAARRDSIVPRSTRYCNHIDASARLRHSLNGPPPAHPRPQEALLLARGSPDIGTDTHRLPSVWQSHRCRFVRRYGARCTEYAGVVRDSDGMLNKSNRKWRATSRQMRTGRASIEDDWNQLCVWASMLPSSKVPCAAERCYRGNLYRIVSVAPFPSGGSAMMTSPPCMDCLMTLQQIGMR